MILAKRSEMTRLYEVDLPDGRQLIDISSEQLAGLACTYNCPVEIEFHPPEVHFIPRPPDRIQV